MQRHAWLPVAAILAIAGGPAPVRADEPVSSPPTDGTGVAADAPSAPARAPDSGRVRWPGPHLGMRRIASVDLQGAYNPLGIQVIGSIVQRHVYDVDESRNIEWSYLQMGLGGMISPAIAQASVHVEWMPAAFFTLRLDTALIGYYGTMGALRQFDERPRHFDADRHADTLPGHDRTGFAYRVMLQPTLALQQGWFIFRDQCNLAMYGFAGRGAFFYDYENDTLMAPTELLVYNQVYLLAQAWKGKKDAMLLIGALYDVTYTAISDIRRQRVGGLVLVQPKDPWGPLDRFRIYLMAGVVLEDQNRKYEPFVAGGIGTDFDL